MTLELGEKAKEFDLIVEGEEPIYLKDFQGKNIVLYFYPKDDTPGCTVEANDFKKYFSEFQVP